ALLGKAVQDVDLLEPEDRDRAYGYTLRVWYILGFKGPTGQFSAGSAYPKPDGYSQPLPPVGRRRKATAHCRRKHVPIALSGTAWILHSSCATVSNVSDTRGLRTTARRSPSARRSPAKGPAMDKPRLFQRRSAP